MRKIRVINKNIEGLVNAIAKDDDVLYVCNKNTYNKLKQISANSKDRLELNFIEKYDGYTIETIIKFSDEFRDKFVIETVTNNGYQIYSAPEKVSRIREIVVVDAE